MILLNHHHLYYFWVVAREGSIARACEKLFLAQPTVSAQIIHLEKDLGKKLFDREGRKLQLTESGKLALDYANAIFSTTQEFLDALKDRPSERTLRVQVGVADQVSKPVILKLLQMAYRSHPGCQPTVTYGSPRELLAELRTHHLDLMLTNRDLPVEDTSDFVRVEAGSVPVHFVAAPKIAGKISRFPRDLRLLPLLLPTRASPIWNSVESFLNAHRISPKVAGEFQDVELLRLLVKEGYGVAPLNALAAQNDFRRGTLARLNPRPTGILETLWLVAKKRHHLNPVAEHLISRFRLAV